jgi:hypothetical protein
VCWKPQWSPLLMWSTQHRWWLGYKS